MVIGPTQLADKPGAGIQIVASESKWRRTVPVGIVQHQFRDASADIQFEDCFILFIKITDYAAFDLVQYVGQVLSDENRDNGWGASLAPRR